MEKHKQNNLIKRYVTFFVFSAFIVLIGIVISIPMRVEIHSVGEKPPFVFALFLAISLLVMAIGTAYIAYLYWFNGTKYRKKLEYSINQLAKRLVFFRLPIYNPTFLLWFFRVFIPIATLMHIALFLLVVCSAF